MRARVLSQLLLSERVCAYGCPLAGRRSRSRQAVAAAAAAPPPSPTHQLADGDDIAASTIGVVGSRMFQAMMAFLVPPPAELSTGMVYVQVAETTRHRQASNQNE